MMKNIVPSFLNTQENNKTIYRGRNTEEVHGSIA